MAKNKKATPARKLMESLTAGAEKFEARFNIKPVKKQYPDRDMVPLNMHSCAFHPIATKSDCDACELHCTVLQNVVGPEINELITPQLRNKIWDHFYGPDSPLVDLAEQTGVTLRVQLIRDDPKFAPSRLSRILAEEDGKVRPLTTEEWRRWFRRFWQGYYVWRGVGAWQAAGLGIQSLPKDIRDLLQFYTTQRDILEKPDHCTGTVDVAYIKAELPNASELTFDDEAEAISYFFRMAVRVAKQGGLSTDDLYGALESVVHEGQGHESAGTNSGGTSDGASEPVSPPDTP